VTQLALLEVMDKEPTVLGMWTWGLLLAVCGYAACRRWPWAALIFVPLSLIGTWAVFGEIRDAQVGPAILHEAGPAYPWHAGFSGLVGIALPIAGLVSGRITPRTAHP
jgi:hypothetical protein